MAIWKITKFNCDVSKEWCFLSNHIKAIWSDLYRQLYPSVYLWSIKGIKYNNSCTKIVSWLRPVFLVNDFGWTFIRHRSSSLPQHPNHYHQPIPFWIAPFQQPHFLSTTPPPPSPLSSFVNFFPLNHIYICTRLIFVWLYVKIIKINAY